MIPAVLAVLVAAPTWAWAALVALATGVALLEFFGLLRAAGWRTPRWAGLALLAGVVAAAEVRSLAGVAALAATVLIVVPALVLFGRPPVETLLGSAAGSSFAILYVALGAASVVGLRAISWKAVLFLLAVVWAGDSAAYYVGRRWGKRRLAPVVSPKKTWAGLAGQVAGGAAVSTGVLAFGATGAQALGAVALGAALSFVAVVGDLVESTFKRSTAVKDSGGLLPGHGGLLDRLDSLLYAAPVLLGVLTLAPEALPR